MKDILEDLPAFTIEKNFENNYSLGSGMMYKAYVANYGNFGPYWTMGELIKSIKKKIYPYEGN